MKGSGLVGSAMGMGKSAVRTVLFMRGSGVMIAIMVLVRRFG